MYSGSPRRQISEDKTESDTQISSSGGTSNSTPSVYGPSQAPSKHTRQVKKLRTNSQSMGSFTCPISDPDNCRSRKRAARHGSTRTFTLNGKYSWERHMRNCHGRLFQSMSKNERDTAQQNGTDSEFSRAHLAATSMLSRWCRGWKRMEQCIILLDEQLTYISSA